MQARGKAGSTLWDVQKWKRGLGGAVQGRTSTRIPSEAGWVKDSGAALPLEASTQRATRSSGPGPGLTRLRSEARLLGQVVSQGLGTLNLSWEELASLTGHLCCLWSPSPHQTRRLPRIPHFDSGRGEETGELPLSQSTELGYKSMFGRGFSGRRRRESPRV